MKPLAEHMAVYAAYHRDGRNRATHYLGVPTIAFAILVPMAWLSFGLSDTAVSLATIFTAVVLVYYVTLDWRVGVATAIVFVPLLVLAEWVGGLDAATGWWVFAVAFVGGWILQLIGHAFEGRRPALVDNLFQILIAPVFLVAEALFACGLCRDLDARVAELMPRHLPAAPNAARGAGD
jgi:uncharacterized membrane protein YGL010W